MITCKNCGAEFDAKALKCPYCGHENVAAAQEDYNKKMDVYVKEREEINKLPNKVANRLALILGMIVLLVVVIMIIYPVLYKMPQNINQQNKEMAIMEQSKEIIMDEYIDAGNYQEFHEFYEGLDNAICYSDYWEINHAYDMYLSIGDKIGTVEEDFDKVSEDYRITLVSDVLRRLRNLSDYVAESLSDDRLYGNETYLEEILGISKILILEKLPLDSELLEEILAVQDKDEIESLYSEYSKIIIEKMK